MIIGIDPGIAPALAAIDKKGDPLWVKDIASISLGKRNVMDSWAVKDLLVGATHVFIEKAQTMPGQGISSTGNYMKCAGILEGICVGLGIPFTLVSPVTWKKKMLPDMAKGKEASLVRVQQLCPGLLKLKKDNHKAEAYLIALYGQVYVL